MGDWSRSLGTKNGMVGYQIRLESKVAEENVLVFCTTVNLLLQLSIMFCFCFALVLIKEEFLYTGYFVASIGE